MSQKKLENMLHICMVSHQYEFSYELSDIISENKLENISHISRVSHQCEFSHDISG